MAYCAVVRLAVMVASLAAMVQEGAHALRGRSLRTAVAAASPISGVGRNLQEDVCAATDGFFVDSAITDLGIEIAGCYSSLSSDTSEYPVYIQGGGDPAKGKALMIVSSFKAETTSDDDDDEQHWSIAIIEEVTETDGVSQVSELRYICSAAELSVDDVSDPSDALLYGTWSCTYFMDGVTNYSDADFQQVECGCEGKTVTRDVEESDGDDGGLDSVEIGIAVAGAALLFALVGACSFAYSKRKRGQEVPPPKTEDVQVAMPTPVANAGPEEEEEKEDKITVKNESA